MKSLLLVLVIAMPSFSAIAATATADALQVIETAISITKTADLDFGVASQSDAALTLDPTTMDASLAMFNVAGEANKAYTIALPADGDVVMQTAGGGSAENEIAVNAFASEPAAGANGQLDGSGLQDLWVGATRDAILANQTAGSYSDTFTVTVFY